MSSRIAFDISDDLAAETAVVAAELGVSEGEMAKAAFESYMDGVRAARLADADETS